MKYVSYFVRKRARFIDMSGSEVNLRFGIICESHDDLIFYKDRAITHTVCDNAKNYFVQNDDGKGETRANLINRILKTLEKRYPVNTKAFEVHRSLWNKVWEDKLCNKYRRKDHDDHWLWSQDFYNAPIDDLIYIAKLLNIYVKGDI